MPAHYMAVKHLTMWQLPYWKVKWNGLMDYIHFRACYNVPNAYFTGYVDGFVTRGECGRCGANLDVWCGRCKEEAYWK